jgi:para-nitrobenzyl esterase
MNAMARDWCERHGGYAWYFDRQLPGDENGAWHSSELWYFFGTLDNCWRPFTEHDYKLSDVMSTALCNFARTGNPNEPGEELWKQTSESQKQMMVWGEKLPHMAKPSAFKMWKTMLTNKNVGE